MKKLAALAAVPLFAGFLWAQQPQSSTTTTTERTWDGTLVDQGCYTTHTQEKTSNPDNSTTTTNRYVTECPATESTTSFGLVTPDGKFVRFDNDGNTRVVEMFKNHKDWRDYANAHKPVKVHVIGTENGDLVVIKEIR